MAGSGPDFFPGGSWGPILAPPSGPEKAISRLLWDLQSRATFQNTQPICDRGPYWDEWYEAANNARHAILRQKCAAYHSLSNSANRVSFEALVLTLGSKPYCQLKRFGIEIMMICRSESCRVADGSNPKTCLEKARCQWASKHWEKEDEMKPNMSIQSFEKEGE
ncbi:hypothetical protein NPIL_321861 [Nephila pilipes]|uniref:Uncharacterized protein n=1 Tax=Nephila pilipes TaxID=299642 RepID=A0A8X6NNF4_NEPPI|nr:hypothetical protein NPIL_321861 [Nephila pilipes]